MNDGRPGTAWAESAGELVEERGASPGREDERERDLVRVYLQPGQLYA